MDKMEKIEDSETHPSIYENSVYDKAGIVDQQGSGGTEFSVYDAETTGSPYERA